MFGKFCFACSWVQAGAPFLARFSIHLCCIVTGFISHISAPLIEFLCDKRGDVNAAWKQSRVVLPGMFSYSFMQDQRQMIAAVCIRSSFLP